MQTIYQTTGGVSKGARYRIAYNFKANYSYIIYVTAAAVENTLGFPTGPFLRLDVNNNGGGGSTGCNGPETVNYNAGGNPAAVKLSSDNFQEFQFVFPPLGTQPTLEVTAFPEINGGTKTVRIRKIRIVETPPAATFTITPSPIPIFCGIANPITLTINNMNNTPGVTGYTWNLGANNNWLYNGNPAPATIATTTNTLTLTPVCNITPGNISATVSVGTLSYQTNTATVSFSNNPPSLVISGQDEFCTSANYTLPGTATCGASIAWSLQPLNNFPTPVSLSCTNCQTTTLTKVNGGTALLRATVTFPNCNSTGIYEKYIGVGVPQFRGWYNSPTNSQEPLNPWTRANLEATNLACYGTYITTSTDITANANVVWQQSGIPAGMQWYQTGNNLRFIFFDINQEAFFTVTITNSCGTTSIRYRFTSVGDNCSGGGLRVQISPNPATSTINVSLTDKSDLAKQKEITEIHLVDKMGNVKQKWSYGKGSGNQTRQINVSSFPADIYAIIVFDGANWTSEKFIKQ